MKRNIQQLRQSLHRLKDRAARVGRRSRPGSVLIIVVALLVLMAIIGTAYISSARTDRYSAAQNSFNTQIDLLVTGVLNQALALIDDPSYQAAGGKYYDDTSSDTWLADRCPVRLRDAAPTYDGNASTVYSQGQLVVNGGAYYVCTTNNTTGNAPPSANWVATGWAPTDIVWPAVSGVLATSSNFEDISAPGINVFKTRLWCKITYLPVGGANVPAMQFYDPATSQMRTVRCGSATNDGIADSFMWRLPVGQINGVTYFTSVRIIDANSAINVNTASSRALDFDYQGKSSSNTLFGFFPANVGLAELLKTWVPTATTDSTIGSEFVQLNDWRYNTVTNPSGVLGDATSPYDDSGAPRTDFKYLTRGDALMSGLGRRIENPGYVGVDGTGASKKFRAFSWPDSAQLAYRGELVNLSASASTLETRLSQSLYSPGSGTYPYAPFDAANYAAWYSDYYDFYAEDAPSTAMIRRPILVARNPLNNYMPAHSLAPIVASNPTIVGDASVRFNPAGVQMPAYDASNSAPRCSINTANFGELWRGFWNAMYDLPAKTNSAVGMTTANLRQLTSSIRDPSVTPRSALPTNFYIAPDQMLLLRSGLAAVNAIDLRDSDSDVTKVSIPLKAIVKNASTNIVVNLFGTEMQPYITEVYANNYTGPNTNGKQNPKGYVGVSIYNPGMTPISLQNWQVGIITNRLKTPAYSSLMIQSPGYQSPPAFAGFDSTAVVPAQGYLVLENYSSAGTAPAAQYRPYESYPHSALQNVSPVNYFYVAGLCDLMPADATNSGEFVLLRPATSGTTAGNLSTYAPVDSFDFTGTVQAPAGSTKFRAIHYARAVLDNSMTVAYNQWRWVYPGKYDPSQSDARQEGTQIDAWDTSMTSVDPWQTTAPSPEVNMGKVHNVMASYTNPYAPIQLAASDWGFDRLLKSNPTQVYPFGGFARDADVLQTPFIGAYSITDATGNLLELNPVSMDSQLADDNYAADDAYEQIGRFCPISSAGPQYAINTAPGSLVDLYDWAGNILAYFTTQSPCDDFLPNVPLPNNPSAPNPTTYYLYDPSNDSYTAATAPPQGVLNRAGTTPNYGNNRGNEDLVPIEGRININTAGWRVLTMLPMVKTTNNGKLPLAAQAIVRYRLAHGPFKSILDLNRAYDNANPGFPVQSVFADPATADYNNDTGDPTPWQTGDNDRVENDFENRYDTVARLSNLITTRSDTFTIYVQVQGFRGVGTAAPELVVQRHAAVIVDRSQITANNKSAVVQHAVPTN